MQYGGMFYLYIEYPNSVKNYWIKLGCVYMEVSHLHIETCFEMILIQVLSQQIFFGKYFSGRGGDHWMSNMQKTWKRILVKTNCMQAHSFESVRMRKSSTKSLTVNQALGRLSSKKPYYGAI